LEKIGPVAYRLALSPELEKIHNVFHKSQLKKFISDPNHVISHQPLQIQEDLSFVEEPIQILDHELKTLRNKYISLVKVLWRSHQVEEITWEPKEEMWNSYPRLFQGMPSFGTKLS